MKKHSKLVVRAFSFLLAAVLLVSPLTLGMEAHAADITVVGIATPVVDKGAADTTVTNQNTTTTVIKKGTTTASYLFVRSGAGTKYDTITGLRKGTAVNILEEKDGWYRIESGWISSKYVKLKDSSSASSSTPSSSSTSKKEGNATVTASLLFIRKDPSTNYKAVGMLKKGDRIQVLETNGNWIKIKDGWVYSEYVALDNGSSLYSEKKNAIVTANELNIRETPRTDAKKLGTLRKNQRVEVLETSGEWIRTNYGWINKNFVKLVDAASANNTGTVRAMALNVRKGPGTNYDVVGAVRIGEKVTILENQGDWLRISSGWINADYVKIGG